MITINKILTSLLLLLSMTLSESYTAPKKKRAKTPNITVGSDTDDETEATKTRTGNRPPKILMVGAQPREDSITGTGKYQDQQPFLGATGRAATPRSLLQAP